MVAASTFKFSLERVVKNCRNESAR